MGGLSLVLLPKIYGALERRPGWVPPDPILRALGPAQVSWAIFSLILPSLVLAVASSVRRPWVLIRGGVACVAMFTLRALTMTLVPLAAPADLIALQDPLGQLFYPGGVPETRDLFFSGHTAVMFLLVGMVQRRFAKIVLAAVASAVGVLLLVQHAHWTIDVLTAPVFAALCWRISRVVLPNPVDTTVQE